MNPSNFNTKISLQQRDITVDEIGQEIIEYIEFGTFWASAKTTRSSEAINSGNLESLKQIRFILRYSKKLNELITLDKTHFSLIHKGIQYDVLSVINDDEKNKTVTIVAEGRE